MKKKKEKAKTKKKSRKDQIKKKLPFRQKKKSFTEKDWGTKETDRNVEGYSLKHEI